MATILESVKTVCNVPLTETVFDPDLLLHINSVISTAQNLGVNGLSSLVVDGQTNYPILEEGDGEELSRLIQLWIPLKVQSAWDPSTSAGIREAKNVRIGELEQHIMFACSEEVEEE